MPLRVLLGYLSKNEALINSLAESYPMRRAAQLTAYVYHKGKDVGKETLDRVKGAELTERTQELGTRASSFGRRLSAELKEGFDEMKNQKR